MAKAISITKFPPRRRRRNKRAGGPEATFTQQVVRTLQFNGWLVSHHPDSRKLVGDAGLPDIVAVHPKHGVMFAELKMEYNKLSIAQQHWKSTIAKTSAGYYVWKPENWKDIKKIASGVPVEAEQENREATSLLPSQENSSLANK